MKRASVTIPGELEEALKAYLDEQRPGRPLTSVVQEALRRFLIDQGYLPGSQRKRLALTPARGGSGTKTTSRDHDRVLARR